MDCAARIIGRDAEHGYGHVPIDQADYVSAIQMDAIAAALDPTRNVVVEACAGSGKTWLLVSRIVRLLLAGVAPGEILAITYTRKAANEMASRLREWLRVLALADDASVRRFLAQRGVAPEQAEAFLSPSRQLLEKFLEAQPAMTINTFHGWFLEVLRRAPLNAGAAANATLIEKTSPLLEEAWRGFASGTDAERALSGALDHLFGDTGLSNTKQLLMAFLARRAEWSAYTENQTDPVTYALSALRSELNIDPDTDLRAELFAHAQFSDQVRAVAAAFARGSEANQRLASSLEQALDLPTSERFDCMVKALLTDGGARPNKNHQKAAQKLNAAAQLDAVATRLIEVREQETDQRVWHFNAAAMRCGTALIECYQRIKAKRNGLDFTDVEWDAWKLLRDSEHAEYLQYKLDARYRHILLDEFQDANPLQWQILESWLRAAIDAGSGPRVFLVGDPKQSIYRFRRAESRLFEQAAGYFVQHHSATRIALNISRRSGTVLLNVVNRVFQDPMHGYVAHVAHDPALTGRVEALPLARAVAAAPARSVLRNPLHQPRTENETVAREHEAQQIAAKIQEMVNAWALEDKQPGARIHRRANYGDILLLARTRTHLATYEQALRAARIPYLSSRKGGLLETLEIADLVALLRFLTAPFADLHLANALRSPIFSCSDAELLLLAGREEPSWWSRLTALVEAGAAPPALSRAHVLLGQWLAMTDRLPVHDLLDRVYFSADVIARYRVSVADAMRASVSANLTAFLELALALDAGRYPSLPRFLDELANMRKGAAQEAPDEGALGEAGDAVRILTVHGAKGLEAPIVFIIDAHAADQRDRGFDVLLDWPPGEPRPTHFSVYGKKEDRGAARQNRFQHEALQSEREELNALYVAMTRAGQALMVSGSERKKTTATPSWYARICAALDCDDNGGVIGDDLRLLVVSPEVPNGGAKKPAPAPGAIEQAPPPRVGERATRFSSAQTRRGEQVHRLLQFMAPPASVTDEAWLRDLSACDEAQFQEILKSARAILAAAALRRFFNPADYLRASNELPVLVDGELKRIDRVVEFADEVWVLDYKNGETAEFDQAAGAAHKIQLDAYRRAIEHLSPGKTVRCAWVVANGTLHEVQQ